MEYTIVDFLQWFGGAVLFGLFIYYVVLPRIGSRKTGGGSGGKSGTGTKQK